MKVPALVMAGGKGSRMGLPTEKPLILFLGKPLIDWVAQAIMDSKKVSEFHIITSANTPQTEQHCLSKGWKVLHTDAKGYHNDLRQAVSIANLIGPVLTMPSDVPAITGRVLDKIVSTFEVCEKDFLAVFVPIKARQD
ncbi:MAG: NTP transferase domain-containing protein, partial [Ignavibacteria bacterium]